MIRGPDLSNGWLYKNYVDIVGKSISKAYNSKYSVSTTMCCLCILRSTRGHILHKLHDHNIADIGNYIEIVNLQCTLQTVRGSCLLLILLLTYAIYYMVFEKYIVFTILI